MRRKNKKNLKKESANSQIIYLDNAATTSLAQEVIEVMLPYFNQKYGNSSSLHSLGRQAKEALEKSRDTIAKSIKAKPHEIIFTSGGTESNNFAIKSIAFNNKDKGNHIITTKVEHKCVLESCKWLEKQGFEITYLGVNQEGFISPEALEKAITDKTILVSIIHGNNEIGTIQELTNLGNICKKHNIYFHTDACQSYTKTELNVKEQPVDLITLNAHKIHGPKGVGALYIREGTKIKGWQQGGDHEFNLRAGTENIPGIVGFARAAQLALKPEHIEHMVKLRDKLIQEVLKIPYTKLNGSIGEKRLCNNINISFQAVEGEALGGYLDLHHIASSSGSACTSRSLQPSHVLKAIGLSDELANSSLRLSLSRYTTEEEIDQVIKILPVIIKKLRKISPLTKVADYVFKKSS